MRSVLVIDDNHAVCTALEVLLSLQGLRVLTANSPGPGLAALEREPIDLVIQDMNFRRDLTAGEEGVELYHHIKRKFPDTPIVLLTAWTHLETAVELVKAGAADYIAKPWEDARLLTTVRNLLQLRSALVESAALKSGKAAARETLARRFELKGIVYESDVMHALVSMATQVAPSQVPVLITGLNGAGKEVLADILQANSSCSSGPFVKVNAGALPPELIESELFGADSGAFTGARSRPGRFEAANGGTLFLDEIANLPHAGQAKLLRVLQTGEFERLGSNETRRVRVRVISATNTDLAQAIREGRFREDLFYRLNVIELKVPPLAERREDIVPLARHFLGSEFELDAEAERTLGAYGWPGNVRELSNAMQRAMLLAENKIVTVHALGLRISTPAADLRAAEPDRFEIEHALTRAGGIVARAARELGLSRQALYRRMDKLGLRDPAQEARQE
ncbi:MAG: sigma-54-dependent transcriptional regulator [Steroidobacterales bacterium]